MGGPTVWRRAARGTTTRARTSADSPPKRPAWGSPSRWTPGRAWPPGPTTVATYGHEVDPVKAERTAPVAASARLPKDTLVWAGLHVSPDGKYLLSLSGHVLRLNGGALVLPEGEPRQAEEKAAE